MMRDFEGVKYPEMSKKDYKLLIKQLQDDDEIQTKEDAIRFIEDSVFELDDRDAIPMRWLNSYMIYLTNDNRPVLHKIMREWIQACDQDDAIKEIE